MTKSKFTKKQVKEMLLEALGVTYKEYVDREHIKSMPSCAVCIFLYKLRPEYAQFRGLRLCDDICIFGHCSQRRCNCVSSSVEKASKSYTTQEKNVINFYASLIEFISSIPERAFSSQVTLLQSYKAKIAKLDREVFYAGEEVHYPKK